MEKQSKPKLETPLSCQNHIPADARVRELIKGMSGEYVRDNELLAPLSAKELTFHARKILAQAGESDEYVNFAGVVINNELWRDELASVPYDRRLLLLPQCLREVDQCSAQKDEYGFLCKECGNCLIGEFQKEAERLGYAVLVAEGSPVVMSLIASGQVEAVIGIGCLEVLEGVFPYIESGAIPAAAIPLLNDGCRQTSLDAEWVWQAIYEKSDGKSSHINIPGLKPQVRGWFENKNVSRDICTDSSQTGRLALQWLTQAGKRWRPLLLTCAYQALKHDGRHVPESVRKSAVAIECFHKASLVHDDIEDADPTRYGEKTLHARHGMPIALNVGDYLLGEGYRILSAIKEPDTIKTSLINTVALGHTELCQGQGKELSWQCRPWRMTVEEVINISILKTATGFYIALACGAILARADKNVYPVLNAYTEALGVAYQVKDDLSENKSLVAEPSILLALAYERADEAQKRGLDQACQERRTGSELPGEIKKLMNESEIRAAAKEIMEDYKEQAINALHSLTEQHLKSLLRLLVFKIFDEKETMECCDEHRQ